MSVHPKRLCLGLVYGFHEKKFVFDNFKSSMNNIIMAGTGGHHYSDASSDVINKYIRGVLDERLPYEDDQLQASPSGVLVIPDLALFAG